MNSNKLGGKKMMKVAQESIIICRAAIIDFWLKSFFILFTLSLKLIDSPWVKNLLCKHQKLQAYFYYNVRLYFLTPSLYFKFFFFLFIFRYFIFFSLLFVGCRQLLFAVEKSLSLSYLGRLFSDYLFFSGQHQKKGKTFL